MENITIEGTLKTPAINFDGEKGLLEIKGRSLPENPTEFYQPLIDSLNLYAINPHPVTRVNFSLEYLNTSSAKTVLIILRRLEAINKQKNSMVIINWHYEEHDEDMRNAGDDYSSIVNLPFKIIKMEYELGM